MAAREATIEARSANFADAEVTEFRKRIVDLIARANNFPLKHRNKISRLGFSPRFSSIETTVKAVRLIKSTSHRQTRVVLPTADVLDGMKLLKDGRGFDVLVDISRGDCLHCRGALNR